jgi:hypothetical protein
MKKTLSILLILFQSTILFSQSLDSIPTDKSVVYFTRASALGALINFTYFDGEKVIGRFNGPKYMKYVCDPGKHLFWARSENKSFVDAELKAGEIYIIDVIPRMGGLKASVKITPVDKAVYNMKRIQKLLSKREPETFTKLELDELQNEMSNVIIRGMEKYNDLKNKDKEINFLKPEMTVSKEDLIFVKKKKN